MAYLIDKNTLVAKIENRIKELQNLRKENEEKFDSAQKTAILLCIDECKVILSIIDTLEMKEVDLEEEIIKECPFKKVGCEMYEGHILECKGTCSWVVDHLKLKELKAQKGE